MRKKHFYAFVIKSVKKEKKTFIGGRTNYFARRTSLKNPRFASNFHLKVKLFETKDEAERYFIAKCRVIQSSVLNEYRVSRIKLFLDHKGEWDYWKNREVLYK